MKFFRNTFLALALLIGLPALVAPPAMATQILLNNVKSKLTAAVGVSDTSITITTGDGALFAGATGGNTITATMVKISGFREYAWEIVTVTARSGDTLTITRARESTTALTFAIGDVIDVRFTAGMTPGAIGAATLASPTFTGTVTLPVLVGTDTTDASSSTTGAFKTAGGLGVAKKLYVGTDINVGNALNVVGLTSIGDTTAISGVTQTGLMVSTDTGTGHQFIMRKSNAGAQAVNVTFAKSRGTAASPGAVVASDFVVAINADAYDGAAYGVAASLQVQIDGTPGSGSLPGKLLFNTTPTGAAAATTRLTIDARGQFTFAGGIATGITTQTGATYTVLDTDYSLIANRAGTITYTLPAASSYTGRWLMLRTITANTVVSATSNVVPAAGGAAGTAILAATAGKWAALQSDGTSWQIMMSN